MFQCVIRVNTEQDINIGQTGIGIKQADFVTPCSQGNGQVDRNRGFTDTTFTAGDSNNAGRFRVG